MSKAYDIDLDDTLQRISDILDGMDRKMIQYTIENNKNLVEKYPFLLPRNAWTGKVPDDYDYSWTELDSMPDGWRIAFGEQMCEEIAAALNKEGLLDSYRILQIKEKYGSLRWYDSGATDEVYKIIAKYERMSERICLCCGKPATKISCGWISPFCDDCAETRVNCNRFIPIEEYFSEDTTEEGGEENDIS